MDHLQNGKKLGQGTDKYRNGISYVASFKMAGNMARGPTDKYRNGISHVAIFKMARIMARVPTNTKTALAMWTSFKMARNLARVLTNTERALATWPVSRWQ